MKRPPLRKARVDEVKEDALWKRVFRTDARAQQQGRCAYCKEPLPLKKTTADHVTPRVKGGATDRKNIKAACRACNMSKGHLSENAFMNLVRSPPQGSGLHILLAHFRWRLHRRELLAHKRIRRAAGLPE